VTVLRFLFHVFIADTPRAAGNQQTIRIAYYLARAGANVTLYVGTSYFGSRQDLMSFFGLNECDRFEVIIQRTPGRIKKSSKAQSRWGMIFHFRRLMHLLFTNEKHRYDVFFARGYRFPTLHVLLKQWLGYKVVFELHEIIYLDKVPEDSLFVAKPFIDFEKYTFLHADGRLAISQSLLDFADRKWGVVRPARAIHSCAIPFDSNPIPPNRVLKKVYYVGNFYPLGGLDYLVRAMPLVPDAHLTVVGGGGENDLNTLRILDVIDDCKVCDRIDLTGFVEPGKLSDYYRGADILVMPLANFIRCKYWMSPLKLFEYLSARRPIIASDHPVVREILKHEHNAILVPAENPKAIAGAIERLMGDRELCRRLAESAYRDSRIYTMDNKAKQILEFIEEEIP